MTAPKKLFCNILILVVAMLSIHATAYAADDFKMIVKNIESRYKAKRKKIPFLGVAGFLVKIVKPAGVKEFKLAVFEDQDFRPGPRDAEFEETVRKSLSRKWQPMLMSRSRLEGNRAYIYSQPSGKDIKLLSVTFERRQAIVVQAKVQPDKLMEFMEKPEIMGKSLAGLMGNGSTIAGGNTSYGGRSSRDSGDHSLDSLRSDTYDPPPAKSKPVLKVRSEEEADPELESDAQPVAGNSLSPAPAEKDVIKLEARLVNLNVRAIDRAGQPLPDLTKADFEIYEDGARQDIFSFEPVNSPINVVLLLDLSGSTKDKRKIMARAAKKFIDSLGQDDLIAIAAFTRDYVMVSDFTKDHNLLKSRVDKIDKIQGGTAFYDAMWKTLDLLRRVEESRRAIVVLTDGADNSISGRFSTEHTFDELLSRVMEEEATIYPIYFSPDLPISIDSKGNVVVVTGKNKDQKVKVNEAISERLREKIARPHIIARAQLEALAEETAGMVFEAKDEDDLEGVYERVAAELHLLYSLSYSPKNTGSDGAFRKIKVEVNRDGSVAKTRRGYYAR